MRLGTPRGWLVLSAALMMLGCASNLATEVPPRFDISGSWTLESDVDRPEGRNGQHGRGGRRDLRFDPALLPMLYARGMRIEQDVDSMGVGYREGAYRDVSWGTRKLRLADVEAGWDGPDLVIRTESPSYDMTERYRLSEDGKRMHAIIDIEPAHGEKLRLRHVYLRD